ncbi:MAG: serine/threonine-protein kinase [Planctomycetota bacterium]
MPGSSDSNIRKSIGSAGASRPGAAEIEAARRNPNLNLGRTVLLEELGRGGMGVVYRAWQDDLQRTVAVKILAAHAPGNANERFLREARLASKLRHPNIVTVHEMGEHQGRPWFSMDIVEGGSLDPLMRGRKLPAKKLFEILRDMALALEYAHQQGVVHRDIKPGNILIDAQGKPYLTDFGLAGDLEGAARLTMTGTVMGTPAYMSPEQARGSRGKPDHRTDIYSMGAVMYEGLTGRTAVPKDDIVVMVNHVINAHPEPPRSLLASIPEDAETICLKCLQKEPERRYQSAKELADDIDRFLQGKPIKARASTLLEKASRSAWMRPPALAGMAAGILAIVLAAWGIGRSRAHDRELEQRESALKSRESEIRRLEDALAKATDPEEKKRLAAELAAKTGAPGVATDKKPPATTGGGTTEKPPDPVVPVPPRPERIDGLESELTARLLRGEYSRASLSLEAFLPATPKEREWQASARARIHDAAARVFEGIDERAKGLLAAGRIDEAIATWNEANAIGLQVFTLLAAERIESARSPATKPREAALLRLGPLRDTVSALASKRNYDESLKEIATLEKAEPSLVQDLLPLREAVEAARSVFASAAKGAAASKGKEIATKVGPGKIEEAGDKTFKTKVGSATLTFTYAELAAEPLVQLAEAGQAQPEAIGVFWLFEGRADLAAKAWTKSPRKPDLDALAASLRAASLEREARGAVEDLLTAAEKKDWKRCREILALRDRYAGTTAWGAISERLEDIAFEAAEKKGDELFAVAGRKVGAGQEWRYDFKDAAQLRDWGQTGGGFYSATGSAGLGWDAGSASLSMTGAEYFAPVEGEQRLAIEITLTTFAREGCVELLAGGYRVDFCEGGYANLHGPDGKRIAEATLPSLVTGKPVRIELNLADGRVRALLDGKEVLSGEMAHPILPMPPRIDMIKSAAGRIHRATLSGRIPPGWAETEKSRRAVLARAGRPSSLGKPLILTDGKSMGVFTTAEGGAWEVRDGALRGSSPSDGVHAELHYPEPKHRNVRLKFSYQIHSGRLLEVLMRGGNARVGFNLPTDRPGKWREVEILMAEESVQCLVDGQVPVLGIGQLPEVAEGGLRFTLQTTVASIRNMTMQEIKGLPATPEWTVLLDGNPVPEVRAAGPTWNKDSRLYAGMGSLEFDLKTLPCEYFWRLEDCHGRFTLEVRGQKVADFFCALDHRILLLRVRGDAADVLLNGVELARDIKLPKGTGSAKLTASEGDAKIPSICLRPLR